MNPSVCAEIDDNSVLTQDIVEETHLLTVSDEVLEYQMHNLIEFESICIRRVENLEYGFHARDRVREGEGESLT